MELKVAKYKQTEVGLIPEDWKLIRLGDYIKLKNGYAFSSVYFSNRGPIVMTPGNFKIDGGLKFEERNTIRFSGQITKEMCFNNGDLIMVMTDLTPDCNLLGKSGIVNSTELLLHNQRIGKIIIQSSNIDKGYLNVFFNSWLYSNRMKSTATGSTVRHTSVPTINNTVLALPTLEEQKAIATALSDVDELIINLDQLITKKKAIKQGAMQQLLTPPHKGGKRLDGFSGEWVEKKLGDIIIQFQNGYAFSANGYKDEGIPIVTMAQIGLNGQFQYNENKVNYWSIEELKSLKDFTLYKGDIIMSMTDVTPEKNLIGRMTMVNEKGPLFLNQRVGHLRINKELVNPIILKHLSNMKPWRTYSMSIASLGVQANIGTTDIKNGVFWLPKIEEQNAIAEILSDMDLEIEQLETKKAKYQQIKQGMMQELLTGKTRLI